MIDLAEYNSMADEVGKRCTAVVETRCQAYGNLACHPSGGINTGRCALVTFNPFLIPEDLEMPLAQHRIAVGNPASTMAKAWVRAKTGISFLGVKLHGDMIYLPADQFSPRGLPIIPMTGCPSAAWLPPRIIGVPTLRKFCAGRTLLELAETAFARAREFLACS